jgi:hypothetical protein
VISNPRKLHFQYFMRGVKNMDWRLAIVSKWAVMVLFIKLHPFLPSYLKGNCLGAKLKAISPMD